VRTHPAGAHAIIKRTEWHKDRRIMDDIGNADRVAQMQRLAQLKQEHRDLDSAIGRLAAAPDHDQLQVTRLKRRKLLLKDNIARLEREIDPDILA
jgi:hypothetical protein